MRFHTLALGLAAGLALGACADLKTTSGPPPSGTSAGPGSPPLQQQTGAIGGGSANASGGQASFGNTQGARPEINYTGPATGNAGSPTPPTLPTTGRSRSN